MITLKTTTANAPKLDDLASARFIKPEGREYPVIALTTLDGNETILSLNPGEDRKNTIAYLNSLPGVNKYREWKYLFGEEKWYNNPNLPSNPCCSIKVAVIFLNYAIQLHKAMVQVAPALQIEADRFPLNKIDKAFEMWGGYYEKMMDAASAGDLSWLIAETTEAVNRLIQKEAKRKARKLA